jgi:glyoxylase-like metal-dependent hydrolase (beta-lactamase superfamily II)
MIHEIFPCLHLVRTAAPGAKVPYTYLLRRPAGNILLATKADMADNWDALRALGPVSHILLGDRHHVGAASAGLSAKLGVPLSATRAEAVAARQKDLSINDILPDGRYHLADDLEVIPTPGHTKGAVSYLWSHEGRRFLFIGDTLVPIDGRWAFWVTPRNRPVMRQTIDRLRGVAFDVILSNSFACTPDAWFELGPDERAALFQSVTMALRD